MRALALVFCASVLTGCSEKSPPPAPPSETCGWVEAFSGRYYDQSAYDQVHWRVEIERKASSGSVCATHPLKRSEGAGTCLTDRVATTTVLGSTRMMVRHTLNDLKLISGDHPAPTEIDSEVAWRQMVGLSLAGKFKGPVEFCRVRIVVNMKWRGSTPPEDGKWWKEHIKVFPENAGECCG